MRTAIARLGLTALLASGGLALAGPAQAAGCGDTDGVTVVVEQGGKTSVECASGDPKTAGEALESAGFTLEKVQSEPNMLCTIDGHPKVSCAEMPEADSFWAFFTASDGGAWKFADKGVFAYDPKPGTSIGFRFGGGDEPTMSAKEAATESGSAPETNSGGESEGEPSASSAEESGEEGGSTTLVTTLAGVGVIAVLAGAGFLVARRRRS